MPQQAPPIEQIEFHGVHLVGNPAKRPRNTAAVCQNFRIMPGYWLRLRGGRKGRYNLSSGEVYQIHPYRLPGQFGSDTQLVQIRYGASSVKWSWLSLATYIPDPINELAINTTLDSAFAASNAAAVTNLVNRVLFYNGLGVRDATNSRPPMTTLGTNGFRYFGLDAYCPSANPTVAFAGGAGNNTVATRVKVYCGLYHSATGHFSNAVSCGEITTTGGTGTITVSNLSRLTYATNNATETSELFYVFYATIDGGSMPYLILNSGLTGPHTVAVSGATTASLSIAASTTNGWVLDLTKEAPTTNYPPRPMRSLCYLSGRIYGVPLSGGSGSAVSQVAAGSSVARPDFTYQWEQAIDYGGVWASASASDRNANERLGDPLQCWPLTNFYPTPDADQPIAVKPAPGEVGVVVWTAGRTYLLQEASDGIHEYTTLSPVHGLSRVETVAETPRGLMWVTQRKEIALYGADGVVTLSGAYQGLLQGKTVRFADYLLDPVNQIDRYEVHCTDGTVVVHDFAIGGEGYSSTMLAFTAGRTVADSQGRQHHILAGTAFYTQESQPETGLIPTGDETFTTGQAVATAYPTAIYTRNWDCLEDRTAEKLIREAVIQGDGTAVVIESWKDFAEVVDANKSVCLVKALNGQTDPTATDDLYAVEFMRGKHRQIKIKFTLTPAGAGATFAPIHTEGDLATNFWGSIVYFGMLYDKAVSR